MRIIEGFTGEVFLGEGSKGSRTGQGKELKLSRNVASSGDEL